MTEVVKSRLSEESTARTIKATPLRDLLYPEDQADAVVFFASDRARMITGQYIVVDGGISIPIGSIEWENFYALRKQWLKEKKWEGKETSL
jgi:NAD(P)-dependent dehydrogenase (short-subunit alcohol dehydrogenase family)